MSVNIVAVIIAAAVNMIVGSLWYSKMLFVSVWLKTIGKGMEDLKDTQKAMGFAVIVSLVEAYILGLVIKSFGAMTPIDGAKVALLVAVGFVATTQATHMIFEGRPLKLYKINVGYQVVTFVLMGIILGMWG